MTHHRRRGRANNATTWARGAASRRRLRIACPTTYHDRSSYIHANQRQICMTRLDAVRRALSLTTNIQPRAWNWSRRRATRNLRESASRCRGHPECALKRFTITCGIGVLIFRPDSPSESKILFDCERELLGWWSKGANFDETWKIEKTT